VLQQPHKTVRRLDALAAAIIRNSARLLPDTVAAFAAETVTAACKFPFVESVNYPDRFFIAISLNSI
jgi:hypothetical protein